MLQDNNPEIDLQVLEARLSRDIQTRRRDSLMQATPLAVASVGKPSLRQRLQRYPLLVRIVRATRRTMHALTLHGLPFRERVRMLPLVGRAARWTFVLLQLPRFRDITLGKLQVHDDLFRQHTEAIRSSQAHLQSLQDANNDMSAALLNMERQQRAWRCTQENRIASLQQQLREAEQLLLRGADECAAPLPRDTVETALLDSYYVAFEDAFRGSREEIKARQTVYLPVLRERAGGQADWSVLDIGCGRGEWLELLTENGIACRGIDLNQRMAEQCRQHGLDVTHGDAISYLNSLPAGSLGAVTGFHLIEHIPFEVLLQLFDAALRALRPDGLVIFETPNPENVIVGSCSFYNDSTHLNPIPPLVLEFLAQHRGYARTEIRRLHPVDAEWHVKDGSSELAQRFNHLMYGPQDYALIAWKRHAD